MVVSTNSFALVVRRGRVGIFDSLEVDHMDDTGMYIWAGVVTLASLALSFLVAVWWQKRKEKERTESN